MPTDTTTATATIAPRFEVWDGRGSYFVLDNKLSQLVDPDWYDYGVRASCEATVARFNADDAAGVEPNLNPANGLPIDADVLAARRAL